MKNYYCKFIVLFILSFVWWRGCIDVCAENNDAKYREIKVSNYKELQNALNNAKNGDRITVIRTIGTSKSLMMNKDVQVSIDFGTSYRYTGKKQALTISKGEVNILGGTLKSKNYSFVINDNGNLIINDGKFSGFISNKGYLCIENGNYNSTGTSKSKRAELIQNKGDIIINEGVFSNATDHVVYNNAGVVEINGGKFQGKSKKDVFAIYNKKGEMVINSGTFSAINSVTLSNEATVVINGGIFKNSNSKHYVLLNSGKAIVNDIAITGNVGNKEKGTMTIKGGSFKSSAYCCVCNDVRGRLKISGGNFSYTGSYACILNSGYTNILGGKFICKKSMIIYNSKEAIIKITDGDFTRKSKGHILFNRGTAYLYGGTMNFNKNYYAVINYVGAKLKVKKKRINCYDSINWNYSG